MANSELDIKIKPIKELNADQLEAVIQLILDSQRYQKGEFDKDDVDNPNFESDWREFFARILKDDKQVILVSMKANKPIGYIRIRLNVDPKKNGAEIDDVYVLPNYQRQGIAGKLLEQAKLWAGEQQANSLNALVARANTGALKTYDALGFKLEPSSYLNYRLGL